MKKYRVMNLSGPTRQQYMHTLCSIAQDYKRVIGQGGTNREADDYEKSFNDQMDNAISSGVSALDAYDYIAKNCGVSYDILRLMRPQAYKNNVTGRDVPFPGAPPVSTDRGLTPTPGGSKPPTPSPAPSRPDVETSSGGGTPPPPPAAQPPPPASPPPPAPVATPSNPYYSPDEIQKEAARRHNEWAATLPGGNRYPVKNGQMQMTRASAQSSAALLNTPPPPQNPYAPVATSGGSGTWNSQVRDISNSPYNQGGSSYTPVNCDTSKGEFPDGQGGCRKGVATTGSGGFGGFANMGPSSSGFGADINAGGGGGYAMLGGRRPIRALVMRRMIP